MWQKYRKGMSGRSELKMNPGLWVCRIFFLSGTSGNVWEEGKVERGVNLLEAGATILILIFLKRAYLTLIFLLFPSSNRNSSNLKSRVNREKKELNP